MRLVRFIPLTVLLLVTTWGQRGAWAQVDTNACQRVILGQIVDEGTNQPLESAFVRIKGRKQVLLSDSAGRFRFGSLCAGVYQLEAIFLQDTVRTQLRANWGTSAYIIRLRHVNTSDLAVVISSDRPPAVLEVDVLPPSAANVAAARGLTLGDMLTNIPGVAALKTGATIVKPVIHGLSGNRVLILNNGARLEGQQWGSEHAPEIDPFFSDKLSVAKGAAGVQYGPDAIGGVVLAESDPLPVERSVNAVFRTVGASNGATGIANARFEGGFGGKVQGLGWRVMGTLKRGGNLRTGRYYMANTGVLEGNLAVALGFRRAGYGVELQYSRFYTEIGIFTGSHIGSVADLQLAIERNRPTTPDRFSYTIARPYQQVTHQTLLAKAYFNRPNLGRFELQFANQQNDRLEYDSPSFYVKAGDKRPQLKLDISTQTVDFAYAHPASKGFTGRVGVSFMTQGNVWSGRFLIPNFRNYNGGVYLLENFRYRRWTFEAGLRFDYRWTKAYFYDSTNTNLLAPVRSFGNVSGTAGASFAVTEQLKVWFYFGTAWRPPTVSELYSNGVHHGAASFERGTASLSAEYAVNTNIGLHYETKKVSVDASAYNYYFPNYIYLNPDLVPVFTIRGSFPAFTYRQTQANLSGIDAFAEYRPLKWLAVQGRMALLWARDLTRNTWIIWVPSHRFEAQLRLQYPRDGKVIKRAFISVNTQLVLQQTQLPPNSDYAPAPPTYALLNLQLGADFALGRQILEIRLAFQNLTNGTYRDYMDRFRYFTDATGINCLLELRLPLTILRPSIF
jgi:iron complex outermembrane recepter protein